MDLKQMPVPVTEIFYALQGEAIASGYPSIFIRLGGCNLTCKGFGYRETHPRTKTEYVGCDSVFSVNKDFKEFWQYFENWKELVAEIDLVMSTINRNAMNEAPEIIFTGGEPLLRYNNQIISNIIQHYQSRKHRVWFETNGTIDVDFLDYPYMKNCRFVISPKLSNSGESEHHRFKPDVINNIASFSEETVLKFVCSKTNLKEEIMEIYHLLHQIPTFIPVYLMPMGSTKEELEENAKAVYESAIQQGFRYSDRLHIRMYNDMKGV